MKKKFIRLLSMVMMVMLILTGCVSPFDKFKKKGPETTEEETTVNTSVTVIGTGEYACGEVITINDIIQIEDAAVGNVINMAILSDTGALLETLDTETEGAHTVSLIVEFLDGGWSQEYTYNVTKQDVLSMLPEELAHNINNSNWELRDVDVYPDGKEQAISILSANQEIGGKSQVLRDDIEFTFSGGKDLWGYMVISNEDEEILHSQGLSPLRDNVYYNSILSLMGAVDDFDTDADVIGWTQELLKEYCTITNSTEQVSLYDIEGNSYPVHSAMLAYNNGEVSETVYQSFWVDYKDGRKLVFTLSMNKENEPTFIPAEESTEVEQETEALDSALTYEDYKVAAGDSYKPSTMAVCSNEDVLKALERLSVEIILGDISTLTGSNTEESTEPVQEETTTNNTVEVETEIETETEEVKGAVGSIKLTYREKHPELYTWPESDVKYRRWNPLIEEDVNYTGVIILPDGTILSVDEDESVNTGQLEEQTSSVSDGMSMSLVSSNATHIITDKNIDGLKIDTTRSSVGMIVATYNGNRYYIEAAKPGTINGYKQTSIYSTSTMLNGSYKIVEDESTVTTSLGNIISYSITYTDLNNVECEKAYMAVYEMSNDYIVVYADNMDDSSDVMISILTDAVER